MNINIFIERLNGRVFFNLKDMKKRVKCIVEHNTKYLKYKHNYEVEAEDENFYYFRFEDELVKYPKFYFIEI